MTSVRQLRARLDKLTPAPVNNTWSRDTGAYHRIFEESEEEQRSYRRMIYLACAESMGLPTPSEEEIEESTNYYLSTERLRGTRWARFVTDWSKPPWEQHPLDKQSTRF